MVIRTAAALLTAMTLTAPLSAQAQDSQALYEASLELYSICLYGTSAEQTSACACTAGYVGGALNDREFDIAARVARIGRLTEQNAPQSQIDAEVSAYYAAGYTEAEAIATAAKLESIASRGDTICAPYAVGFRSIGLTRSSALLSWRDSLLPSGWFFLEIIQAQAG